MTALTPAVRAPVSVNRQLIAATAFAVFGLVDILVFGRFAHHGDATFAWSLPTATPHVGSTGVPASLVCYILGGITLAIAAYRAVATPGCAARVGVRGSHSSE